MTVITYVICDGCGAREADYSSDLASWTEPDDEDGSDLEDLCPACTAKRPRDGAQDSGGGGE